MTDKVTAGFIPLVDAAALLVAADFGFAGAEGLKIELIREVSWANVREKLNAGIFDVAHLLAPMAIASSLDLMPGSVPLTAPYVLATNGNAITVSPMLFHEIMAELSGEEPRPLATAKALARIAARRAREGQVPLTFGSTFPFSCHTYQLRFWMAAGGLDMAAGLRLVVLPPPYMVESLTAGEVDGFCVGAPWNFVAAEKGLGRTLHYGCEIVQHLTEKVLAARCDWARRHEGVLIRLMRAISAAAAFASQPENWDVCCKRLSAPDRIGAGRQQIKAALSGSFSGHADKNFLILGTGPRGRPDKTQAAWLYSQMARWDQARAEPDLAEAAQAVFSADLFDRVFGQALGAEMPSPPADGLGAFAGPPFKKDHVPEYLDAIAP
jgi:ABC-type nitrate/sulfonate/bicarbonate transport system substrate-binding protein